MKNLIALFLSIVIVSGAVVAQDVTSEKEASLKIGQSISDSLTFDGIHSYTINLKENQFVLGTADQITLDMVVKIYDEEDNVVGTFDGPARGPEYFQFNTEDAGLYTIELTPFKQQTGRYSITLQRVEPVATTPDGRINQLMAMYDNAETPGGVVAVVKDGEMIFSKGYGMANLTYDIPLTTDIVNNIGSVSKQFTAMAILLLAEEGKLSLDDDIRTYIPELPDFGETVTLRHFLTHTSGYREFLNTIVLKGINMNDHYGRDEVIDIIKNQPELQNSPGSEFNYNNTGFSLLTLVVEKVTNTDFPDWMKKNIFQPLGMESTQVRKNPDAIIPNSSMGYVRSRNGEYENIRDLSAGMGASSIYTNVHDLAKWIQNYEHPKVGSADIIKQMKTPYVLTSGDTTGYGLGLFISEMNGLKLFSHGGADMAHRTAMLYFPEINGAVFTLSNNSSFLGNISTKTAEEFFGEYMDFDKSEDDETDSVTDSTGEFIYDTKKFEKLAGLYSLEDMPTFQLNLFQEEGKLYLQASQQPKVEIKATSDTTFNLTVVDASITFHKDEKGEVNTLTLHQNGHHKATRIKEEPWAPSEEDLATYTGNYFSEELQTFYEIALVDSALVIQHPMMNELTLNATEKDTFSSGFPVIELNFIRDENKKVHAFTVSNSRTRGIRFEKVELD